MQVTVDTKWCKGCQICLHFCPKGVFEMGSVRNEKGNLSPYAKNIEKCIGCCTCERLCPDFCIDVQK